MLALAGKAQSSVVRDTQMKNMEDQILALLFPDLDKTMF